MPRCSWRSFVALALACVGVSACDVNDATPRTASCVGPNCSSPDASAAASGEPTYIGSGADGGATSTPPVTVKAACGEPAEPAFDCLPDRNFACSSYTPPAEPPPSSSDPLDAGLSPSDASVTDGGPFPAVDGGFGRTPTGDAAPRPYSCQVTLGSDSSVTRMCAAAGFQGLEQACTSSMDCAPGLGCVGMSHRGRCLPFCCQEGASCAADFFCAMRPLRIEALGEQDGPLVPVCVRADNCSLGEPFPCSGDNCKCGPGLACTLINTEGTTACLPPGSGETGDSCPCAAGYVCSRANGLCMKACDLDDPATNVCGSGRCQSTAALPQGWGTCVGVSD